MKSNGLGQHEARGARPLDRVADGVEAHACDPPVRESVEDPDEVVPAERVLDIDVDLLIGEGGPHAAACAIGELDLGER